jgi:hypothetical protein
MVVNVKWMEPSWGGGYAKFLWERCRGSRGACISLKQENVICYVEGGNDNRVGGRVMGKYKPKTFMHSFTLVLKPNIHGVVTLGGN